MPQADGHNKLAHIEFIYEGNVLSFAVNPEDVTYNQQLRKTISKTQSRLVVEDFGRDVTNIKVSGLTGMTTGSTAYGYDGQMKFTEMRQFFDYVIDTNTGKYGESNQKPLYFMNHTDDYNVTCTLAPQGFTFDHNVDKPLLYTYEINLIGLGYAEDYVDTASIHKKEINTAQPTQTGSSGLVNALKD